ncbi:hypothetical protein AX15_003380 [Amanita polypyramis BW_CC]|nr:hypothetical protein AX15_003380 [Amanita polypyramis BW_CC]
MHLQPQLPPEIWTEAFRCLRRHDWIQLRYVCRTFSNIGARFLFSSLRVFFLDSDYSTSLLLYPATFVPESKVPDSEGEERERLSVKSWEILDYITRNPDFAARVRSVTVYAFRGDLAIFESLCLANAIRKLPRLRVLRWLGDFPALTPVVAEGLPADLSSLSLYGGCELGVCLDHVRHLQEFALRSSLWVLEDGLRDPLKRNDGTLRRLSMQSQFWRDVHLRIFNNLTHFSIACDPESDFDLRFVLRHATHLESLSLKPNSMHIEEEFIMSLCDSVDALANLVSLQLDFYGIGIVSEKRLHSRLLDFLGCQPQLRRLYLHSGQLDKPTYMQSLFSLLREMPRLEVLGLKPCHIMFPKSGPSLQTVYCNLIDFLPHKLKALHVNLSEEEPPFTEYDSTFVNGLGGFKHLTYLNLINRFHNLPFEALEFATDNPQLQLIGHNRWLWDVQDDCTRWPSWKSYFAVREDFEDEDHWWLYSAFLDADCE